MWNVIITSGPRKLGYFPHTILLMWIWRYKAIVRLRYYLKALLQKHTKTHLRESVWSALPWTLAGLFWPPTRLSSPRHQPHCKQTDNGGKDELKKWIICISSYTILNTLIPIKPMLSYLSWEDPDIIQKQSPLLCCTLSLGQFTLTSKRSQHQNEMKWKNYVKK